MICRPVVDILRPGREPSNGKFMSEIKIPAPGAGYFRTAPENFSRRQALNDRHQLETRINPFA